MDRPFHGISSSTNTEDWFSRSSFFAKEKKQARGTHQKSRLVACHLPVFYYSLVLIMSVDLWQGVTQTRACTTPWCADLRVRKIQEWTITLAILSRRVVGEQSPPPHPPPPKLLALSIQGVHKTGFSTSCHTPIGLAIAAKFDLEIAVRTTNGSCSDHKFRFPSSILTINLKHSGKPLARGTHQWDFRQMECYCSGNSLGSWEDTRNGKLRQFAKIHVFFVAFIVERFFLL